MKRRQILVRILTITALLILASSLAVAADDDEVDIMPFYLGVSDYYRVPESEVLAVRGRVAPDEVPVVFHLAERAEVRPARVAELRTEGHSWMSISQRLGVAPEAYYVPLEREPGPPYGKAWGYYRNKPRKEWKEWRSFQLSDEEIVDLVNLRFVSDEWDVDRDHIVEMRSQGRDHVGIAREHWPNDLRHGDRPSDRAKTREHEGADHRDAHHEDHHHPDRRGDDHQAGHDDDGRHHDRDHGSDRDRGRGKDREKDKDRKKDDDTPPRF